MTGYRTVRTVNDDGIRQRPTGLYEYRWTEGGTLRRRSVTSMSIEVVREAKRKVLLAELQGIPTPDRTYTLGAWLPVWLAAIPPKRLRDRSRERYGHLTRHWTRDRIGGRKLADITPEDVGMALGRMDREHGLSASTQASAHAILRIALDAAMRSGHCARNVARLIDPPRAEPRPIAPPKGDELVRLRAAIAGDPLEALWLLCLDAGLRQGEALALRWGGVNIDAGMIRIEGTLQYATRTVGPPKSSAGKRTLPLTPRYGPAHGMELLEALERHRARPGTVPHPTAWVFAKPDGSPMHARVVLDAFYDLCRRARIRRYRIHDLRHAAATELLRHHPSGYVSGYLGHSSLAMTDRYNHSELASAAWIEPAFSAPSSAPQGTDRDGRPRSRTDTAASS